MSKFAKFHIKASKLTPAQVLELRTLYAEEGWTQGRLARHFGVTVGQIGRIVRGEAWQAYQRPVHKQEIEESTAKLQEILGPIPVQEDPKVIEEMLESSPPAIPEFESGRTVEDILAGRKGQSNEHTPKGQSNEHTPNVGKPVAEPEVASLDEGTNLGHSPVDE